MLPILKVLLLLSSLKSYKCNSSLCENELSESKHNLTAHLNYTLISIPIVVNIDFVICAAIPPVAFVLF